MSSTPKAVVPIARPVQVSPGSAAADRPTRGQGVRWDARTAKFREADGSTFVPIGGNYANFICVDWVGLKVSPERLSRMSPFESAGNVLEFQDATDQELTAWLSWCQAQGINFLRLFSRGAMSPVQDPLDIGGQVNRPLWKKMLHLFDRCVDAGIRIHFVVVPEPRTSVYMSEAALARRGLPRYASRSTDHLPPHRSRLLDPRTGRLSHEAFFSDPDVLQCHLDYLTELAGLLGEHPAVMALEIYNEQQWAGHFIWDSHDDEIAWTARLVEHLRDLLPHLPICCSFAGFGFAAQDPLLWLDQVPMHFFSPHLYQRLGGFSDTADFATLSDCVLHYTLDERPTMMGEWGPGRFPAHPETARLAVRDMIWFSLLNNCPGFGLWMTPLHGEGILAQQLMRELNFADWEPAAPDLYVDIREQVAFFHDLEKHPSTRCDLPTNQWCPHRGRDAQHRYCTKMASRALRDLQNWSLAALQHGLSYRFTRRPADDADAWPVADVRPDRLRALPRRFQPPRHCHLKYLSRQDEQVHLAYLRQYTYFCEGDHAGRLRGPSRPTSLQTDLPGETYQLTIYDLDERTASTRRVDAAQTLDLGETNHDFVLVWRRPD